MILCKAMHSLSPNHSVHLLLAILLRELCCGQLDLIHVRVMYDELHSNIDASSYFMLHKLEIVGTTNLLHVVLHVVKQS